MSGPPREALNIVVGIAGGGNGGGSAAEFFEGDPMNPSMMLMDNGPFERSDGCEHVRPPSFSYACRATPVRHLRQGLPRGSAPMQHVLPSCEIASKEQC